MTTFVGISLGTAGEASGVALVERLAEQWEPGGPLSFPVYQVAGPKGYPPGTSYRRIAEEVRERLPDDRTGFCVALDWTGHGRQTRDDFFERVGRRDVDRDLQITPGGIPTREDLIAAATSLLEAKELRIGDDVARRFGFAAKLEGFTRRKPGAGLDPFALREEKDDEIVIATLIVLWWASHPNTLNPPRWL